MNGRKEGKRKKKKESGGSGSNFQLSKSYESEELLPLDIGVNFSYLSHTTTLDIIIIVFGATNYICLAQY